MALVVKDRVRETSTSTGTGNLALNGAVQAFQDFTAIGDGNTTYYTVVDATTGDWEVGIGTYTAVPPTLARDTILESSNNGLAVNFTSNVKDVFVTYPAERSVYVEGTAIVPAETSRLGFVNLAQGSGLSVLGVTGNSTADVGSIAAGTDHQVLRRSGTALAFGAVALDQAAAVSGLLPVASGGSGAGTLTGYVKGNGTSAFTASTTIPNTDITGLGTISTQNSDNVTITGGSINNTTVGATTPSTGAFTTATATTGNITTVNATTVDTTNLEVTNLKAKDGTAAGSIADSTGIVTIASSVLTTTAVSGGTINNTSIGATTPSTGAFTNFTASGTADFTSTGAVKIPAGTQAQRPTPTAGMLRFNGDLNEFEGYNGTAWASVGGSAISNDTATTTDLFPTFVNATTGTALSVFTSNAKLLYKPSTGELKVSQVVASNGIVVNSATVTADYTIETGFNASSSGPIAVNAGVTVTVSPGSVWTII
jgi:hypothetical protein